MASPWTKKVVGSASAMIADEAEMRRALQLFADPERGCELMVLVKGENRMTGVSRTLKGSDTDGLVRAARDMPSGTGLYFRLNPVPPTLGKAATDKDVLTRRWLFVDVDPVKADGFADHSATDTEKAKTGETADRVVEYLAGKGWPVPIVTDSGNGHGLFWRCDLPNEPLIRDTYALLLKDLAKRFDGEAQIDTPVFNAGRLAKLPGTWARKGDDTPDRPHRPCRFVSVPDEVKPVLWELLLAASPKPEEKKGRPSVEAMPVNGHPRDKKERYKRATLEGIAKEQVEAPVGERNTTLFKKSARMGNLIAGGVVEEAEGRKVLSEAAAISDPDRTDREQTIERGIKKGLQEPWRPEERPLDPRPVFGTTTLGKAVAAGEKKLTVKLAAVKPLAVDWLVPGRIPKRFVTIFAGRTGVGKSFVSCDLIARLTTGREIPGASGECFNPGGALIVSEDPHDYVLAPRLIAMGADLSRVNAMTWEAMGHYFLGDTEMLEAACSEVEGGVSFVLIDPPTNFLNDVDEHKNAEVRQLVMRVVEWCCRRDVACIFVLHVNKPTGKGTDAINRVMGSVAWVTTARVAHSFCIDPDDPTRCLWMPVKSNLGPLPKGLAYRIEGKPAAINWLGEVDITADEAMNAEPQARKRAVVAADWLIERFREKREWPSDELFEAARQQGVSKNAIYSAKDTLALPKARQEHLENGDRRWVWWVPIDWPRLAKGNNGRVGE